MAPILAEIHKLALKIDEEKSIKKLSNITREVGVTPIDEQGNTILHLLAIYGNVKALKTLGKDLGVLRFEEASKTNYQGQTVLHKAVRFNRDEIVCLLLTSMKPEESRALVMMRNNDGETPLYVAAKYATNRNIFDQIKMLGGSVTTRAHDGSTILHAAINGEKYRLAYYIVHHHPELAQARDDKGMTPLSILATNTSSFQKSTSYAIQNIGMTTAFLPIQAFEILAYSCIPQKYKLCLAGNDVVFEPIRWNLTNFILRFPWLRRIDDAKQKHIHTHILSNKLIEKHDHWEHIEYYEIKGRDGVRDSKVIWEEISSRKKNRMPSPLFVAMKHGISELPVDILEKHPQAGFSLDQKGKNLLHLTVEHKNKFLYTRIKYTGIIDQVQKNWMKADVDNNRNTILHLTSQVHIQGSSETHPLGNIYEQMIRDIHWFKHIDRESVPHMRSAKNKDGKTAQELFDENHEKLLIKAEKDTKDMIQSLMVVAALIGTFNYTALFTLPGGYHQTKGLPVLQDKNNDSVKELYEFGYYIGAALFSSVFALGALLSIQLSRFNYEEFYILLPIKFFIAYMNLYLASAFSITTCVQASILNVSFGDKREIFVLTTIVIMFVIMFVCHMCRLSLSYM